MRMKKERERKREKKKRNGNNRRLKQPKAAMRGTAARKVQIGGYYSQFMLICWESSMSSISVGM